MPASRKREANGVTYTAHMYEAPTTASTHTTPRYDEPAKQPGSAPSILQTST